MSGAGRPWRLALGRPAAWAALDDAQGRERDVHVLHDLEVVHPDADEVGPVPEGVGEPLVRVCSSDEAKRDTNLATKYVGWLAITRTTAAGG